MVVLSQLYLLFTLQLVIVAYLKVLFMKDCYYIWDIFALKVQIFWAKTGFETGLTQIFYQGLLRRFTIKILITALTEFFTFIFGKGHSPNRHYHFKVIRYSRL